MPTHMLTFNASTQCTHRQPSKARAAHLERLCLWRVQLAFNASTQCKHVQPSKARTQCKRRQPSKAEATHLQRGLCLGRVQLDLAAGLKGGMARHRSKGRYDLPSLLQRAVGAAVTQMVDRALHEGWQKLIYD